MCGLLRIVELARPLAHEVVGGPKERLVHRTCGTSVDSESGIKAAQCCTHYPPSLASRSVFFSPSQFVTRSEISTQRGGFGAEGRADLVPDACRRNRKTREAGAPRPKTPVGI